MATETHHQIEPWAARYVGIPFLDKGRTRFGVDCWGLVCLVMAQQFDIRLPSYADEYDTADNRRGVSDVIQANLAGWVMLDRRDWRPGDVALLKIHAAAWHVGLVAGGGWMIHSHQGCDTVLERLDSPAWSRRLMGVYRHAA